MGASQVEDAAAGGEGVVLKRRPASGTRLPVPQRPESRATPGFRAISVYNRGDFDGDEVTPIPPSRDEEQLSSAIASSPTRR